MSEAKKIIISHVFPPMPIRDFDYCAYYEGEEEGASGYGPTEEAAIEDLLENEPERVF